MWRIKLVIDTTLFDKSSVERYLRRCQLSEEVVWAIVLMAQDASLFSMEEVGDALQNYGLTDKHYIRAVHIERAAT